MANTIVTDVAGLMATNVTNITTGFGAGKTIDTGLPEFSKVMNEATTKQNGVKETAPDRSSSVTAVDKSATRNIKSHDENRRNSVEAGENVKNTAKEVVKTVESVKDKIKDTFDVDDEQLESAMETLGMTMQDLLDPTRLSELMMEINGVEDSISLITNAELYTDIKSVMEYAVNEVNTLMENTGITLDDIKDVLSDDELIKSVKKAMDEQALTQESISQTADENEVLPNSGAVQEDIFSGQNITANNSNEADAEVKAEGDLNYSKADMQTVTVISKQSSELNSSQEVSNADEVQNQVTADDAITVTVDMSANRMTDSSEQNSVDVSTNNVNALNANEESAKADLGNTETFAGINKTETTQPKNRGTEGFNNISKLFENVDEAGVAEGTGNTVSTIEVNTVGDVVNTITSYSSVNPDEIISQVTQSIRVNISEDITSMEMQLHPASLGTVNMQVSANNGVITAHLIVQNEAVKAALETQLMTLQETFEAQGQKVEAVEVSVAGYDLNRGNGQDGSEGNNSKEQKNGFKVSGTRRRINLNIADDVDEDEAMPEDEKIARDMMARNGNTVDYSV